MTTEISETDHENFRERPRKIPRTPAGKGGEITLHER